MVRENKVSLLFSQHFYSAPQHILERGENSLGLPPTLSTAHCTVRKKRAELVWAQQFYTGSASLKGWLTGFFLGLIVFMGCSLACVHAWFF